MPHTGRPAGDTDQTTKFETCTTSARKKRVRSLETVGGGEGTKDGGSKIRDVVLQPGMGDSPGKFEETWEHQVDAYEDLAASKLDDDVKIRVVWREAPSKLQDDLLVHTPQFVSNFNQAASNHPIVRERDHKLECE